jgi:hypothetical protein
LLEKLQDLLALQWVYETPLEQLAPQETQTIRIPPPEILTQLYTLANSGHLRKLLAYLDELDQQMSQNQSFTTMLRQLARNFQMDHMCKLLKRYLQ